MQKVEICIKGHIYDQCSGWFNGLFIDHSHPNENILRGNISDQVLLKE